jgi:sporulation protein YlmC with PRC-barrel domain
LLKIKLSVSQKNKEIGVKAMKLASIAGIKGILFSFFMISNAWGQSINDKDQLNIHNAKQGVAREENGKEIGSVVDFIVDLSTGRILFAVISPDTSRQKVTSVLLLPWNLAHVDSTGNVFNFMITDNTVRNAPRLSTKTWERTLPVQVLTKVEKYWNSHSTQVSSLSLGHGTSLCKATTLIGVRVQGTKSASLGTIRELVFDTDDNAIALVVLAQPDTEEHNPVEFVSLSWDQLYVEPRGETVIAFAGSKTLT